MKWRLRDWLRPRRKIACLGCVEVQMGEMTPVVRYVNGVLYRLATGEEKTLTLHRSEPLPAVPGVDVPGDSSPPVDFAHVVNRLKVVSGLSPTVCQEPTEGKIELRIAMVCHVVRARFDDQANDAAVTLTVARPDQPT